jgi:hypothetical protein
VAAQTIPISAYAVLSGDDASVAEFFFQMFPDGLGFLPLGHQILIVGSASSVIQSDARFQDFLSVNASRTHVLGELSTADRGQLIAAAACVIIPPGALRPGNPDMANAIRNGRPIVTAHDGSPRSNPIPAGVSIAETPADFRRLIRQELNGDLDRARRAL